MAVLPGGSVWLGPPKWEWKHRIMKLGVPGGYDHSLGKFQLKLLQSLTMRLLPNEDVLPREGAGRLLGSDRPLIGT